MLLYGVHSDSVTRLDRNEDLALEMKDPTELHWALNFVRSKGDFQRRQHISSRLLSRLAWRISGLIHGSLDNSFGPDWGMDVENGFEGGGKLICKVGGWVCVERGSECKCNVRNVSECNSPGSRPHRKSHYT